MLQKSNLRNFVDAVKGSKHFVHVSVKDVAQSRSVTSCRTITIPLIFSVQSKCCIEIQFL